MWAYTAYNYQKWLHKLRQVEEKLRKVVEMRIPTIIGLSEAKN
jgi:hypothetical protein